MRTDSIPDKRIETVEVVGLGYIGLPTAVMFSQYYDVVGVDVDVNRVDQIAGSDFCSNEPGLASLLERSKAGGRLTVTTRVEAADVFVIAVPTPLDGKKNAILDFVYAAIDSVCPLLKGGELIVVESTCPPGTTQSVVERIVEKRPDLAAVANGEQGGAELDIQVAYCPERILPGNAIEELRTNNRIVGGYTAEAALRAKELYSTICQGEIRVTNAITAELSKLVENAYRDVNLAFANEVSIVSAELGVDVWELIGLVNQHPRVNVLNPGTGVGGHCIAVDPWFIARSTPNARLMETARMVNDSKPHWVAEQIQKRLDDTKGKRVALFGLTFKADIDDFRESPALVVLNELTRDNPDVDFVIVEPYLGDFDLDGYSDFVNLRQVDYETALKGADLIAILVDHSAFKELDWERTSAEILDFRGIRR